MSGNLCLDCGLPVDGEHSVNCLMQWQSGPTRGGDMACVICGSETVDAEKACANCADDWGNISRIIERWKKAKITEVSLRTQVMGIAQFLCDQKGFSEQQAADLLGVSRPTIRSWRGK